MFQFHWLVCVSAFFIGLINVVAAEESLIIGEPQVIDGDGAMVDCWYPDATQQPTVDLLIHFHGAVSVASDNFTKAKIGGALVVINFKGLSMAYSKPFQETPALFNQVLDKAASQLVGNQKIRWGRISVSSFSAGYGAVREILKTPEHFERIDTLFAADSLYASLEKGIATRQPLDAHMRDYVCFAKLASEGKKSFVITHTSQETTYASTTETADYLLESVGIVRQAVSHRDGEGLLLKSNATKAKLDVLGYEGVTGNDHMQHLRQIYRVWRGR